MEAVRAVVAAERQQLLLLRVAQDGTRARDVRQPQLGGSGLDVFVVGHLGRVAVGVTVVFINVLPSPALPELHDLRLNLVEQKVYRDDDNNNNNNNKAICPSQREFLSASLN